MPSKHLHLASLNTKSFPCLKKKKLCETLHPVPGPASLASALSFHEKQQGILGLTWDSPSSLHVTINPGCASNFKKGGCTPSAFTGEYPGICAGMTWILDSFLVQTRQSKLQILQTKPASLQGTCSISKFWKSFTWHPPRDTTHLYIQKSSHDFLTFKPICFRVSSTCHSSMVICKFRAVTPRWSFAPARWTPDQYKHEVHGRRAWKQTCVAGHASKLGLHWGKSDGYLDTSLDKMQLWPNAWSTSEQQVSQAIGRCNYCTAPTYQQFVLTCGTVHQKLPHQLLVEQHNPIQHRKIHVPNFPEPFFAKMLPATWLELIHVIPPKLCTFEIGEVETSRTLGKASCDLKSPQNLMKYQKPSQVSWSWKIFWP